MRTIFEIMLLGDRDTASFFDWCLLGLFLCVNMVLFIILALIPIFMILDLLKYLFS